MLSTIKHLTFIDPITGLNNYFSFLSEILRLDPLSKSNKKSLYIVLISIDNFKKINTFYGYEFGNQVLKKLGENISVLLKENEIASRYFGDEMLLGLQGNNQSEIEAMVEYIIAVSEKSIAISNVQLNLELSCGISVLTSTTTLEDVIRQSTLAKFKAKSKKNKKIVFYNQSIYEELQNKQALEDALSMAITNEELHLLYQPIYDTIKQEIVGYEALLRWNHPTYQFIPISTVIETAETNGSIVEIGEWVFRKAVTALSQLHKEDPTLFMSINVSPIQLLSENFLSFIHHSILTVKIPASSIAIEITENTTMLDVASKKIILSKIKEMGFTISIDDFGTGYSSLNYLSNLPIDTVKIDKQFIQSITTDEYSRTLIAAVIAIVKTLNLSVIAEGVETIEQLNLLHKMGCSIIQGYIISKPIPLDED
jgi:diguanylate cyclase (GGDEF)-like protein